MPSDPGTLTTEDLFQTINANNNWLRFPVVFVGSERADYSAVSSPTQRDTDYQFWFIFLRERLSTLNDVIHSQLARVCRNDPGSTLTANGAHFFSTFIKARILCRRSKPPTFESIHTLDYEYNSISECLFHSSFCSMEMFVNGVVSLQQVLCSVRKGVTTAMTHLQRDCSMAHSLDQGLFGTSIGVKAF